MMRILIVLGLFGWGQARPELQSNADDIQYRLWTRANSGDNAYHVLQYLDSGSLAPLDPALPTVLLVHGFSADANGGWVLAGKTDILTKAAYNVIAVDWSVLAEAPWYPAAANNVEMVGERTAQMLEWAGREAGLDVGRVHMVGHSLGAHVCGSTGQHLTAATLARITGLDPAGPEFYDKPESLRLDPSDAAFVDVIHTNAGGVLDSCVGLADRVGHVDFYPNGGDHQPGCTIGGDWMDLITGGCSHGRSHDFWLESILSEEFVARPCKDLNAYTHGHCEDCGAGCVSMGFNLAPGGAAGLYVLETSWHKPYALGAR